MRSIVLACILLAAASLTGCSRMELNERGFILGVAIDLLEDGRTELTTQFYKPSAGKSGPGMNSSNAFINVTTSGNTVFDAVRDITIHLGRKAQWSHMQSILIGEEIAKNKTITDILDFFYRDHEPRLTTRIFITQGKASRYLQQKPYIETTVSRQLHEIQKSASRFSGKTPDLNLLDLDLQLHTETSTAV